MHTYNIIIDIFIYYWYMLVCVHYIYVYNKIIIMLEKRKIQESSHPSILWICYCAINYSFNNININPLQKEVRSNKKYMACKNEPSLA